MIEVAKYFACENDRILLGDRIIRVDRTASNGVTRTLAAFPHVFSFACGSSRGSER